MLDHQKDYGSQWEAIVAISAKIGCTAESLRRWARQVERDQGTRPGPTSSEVERIKALERENRELRQGLVQPQAAAGTDRGHPASGGRSGL